MADERLPRGTLPFVILRQDDWVSQVRNVLTLCQPIISELANALFYTEKPQYNLTFE